MKSVSNNLWLALSATALFILILAGLDRLYPQVTIAPLGGAVFLFALSLFFAPRVIVLAFLPLAAFVIVSLFQVAHRDWHLDEVQARFLIRVGTFLTAGMISILASFFRSQLVVMLQQTKELLSGLPVGVLLSDARGRIVWANAASESILSSNSLVGRLWEEVLPTNGSPIDYLLLYTKSGRSKDYKAFFPAHVVHFLKLQSVHQHLLVTVIYPKEAEN
jgi:PAS domain-containing protein